MGVAKVFSSFTSKIKKKTNPSGPSYYEKDDEPMWYDRGKVTLADKIFLDRRLRFFVVMFFAAVVLPVVMYLCFYQRESIGESQLQTCLVREEYRVPCFPGQTSITEAMCANADCCFNSTSGECHHTLPSLYGFNIQGWTNAKNALTAALSSTLTINPLKRTTVFGSPSTPSVKVAVNVIDPTHLRITLAHSDVIFNRTDTNENIETSAFNVTVYGPQFFFEVHRRNNSNNPLMLNSILGPLISSEDYTEIALGLSPDSTVYGLEAAKGHPLTLYNSGDRTGSHPVLISVDEFGSFQALLIDTTSPMEIEVHEKSRLVIVRFILNTRFDIRLFAGPTPGEVMDQLTDVIGKPKLPPYWALGLHVCPDLDDDNVCEHFENFMNKYLQLGIPWDSHCLDHSMITNRLFFNTGQACASDSPVWKNAELTGRKLLLSLPVPVPSTMNVSGGAVLQTAGGENYVGKFKQQSVHYPDFLMEVTGHWLLDHVSSLTSNIPSDIIGGYLLQNNWPEEDFTKRASENLDYLPQDVRGSLSNNTVWWTARHSGNRTHATVHNVYGLQHTQRLVSNLASELVVLSTSSYPGLGAFAGCHSHPSVDVEITWTALKEAFSSMIELGLSGIPLAGSPVCGNDPNFNHSLHDELCRRWYQLGALSPLMRVSSTPKLRDPSAFPNSTLPYLKRAIDLRYQLLPYLYTHFEEASQTGMPVARPMSFEFPDDNGTWSLQYQYMLGSSLLVAPVLDPGVVSLSVYIPNQNGTWYFLEGGNPVNNGTGGYKIPLTVTGSQAIALLRPGTVLLLHDGGLSSHQALAGSSSLTVALLCYSHSNSCSAQGRLSLPHLQRTNVEVSANNASLTISHSQELIKSIHLTSLQVYGISIPRNEFLLPVHITNCSTHAALEAQYEKDTNVMVISGMDLRNCSQGMTNVQITW